MTPTTRFLTSWKTAAILAALMAAGAATSFNPAGPGRLIRSLRPSRQLAPVPHPSLANLEQASRSHIEDVRGRVDAILHLPRVSANQQARAHGELGKVYLSYELNEAAAACFQNAEALEPDEFRWPYLRAHAVVESAQTAIAVPAMARAITLMGRDITSTAEDAVAGLLFLGNEAMRQNRPAEARRTLEQALTLQPGSVFALFKLGEIASQAGDHARAADLLQKAVRLAPGRPEIRSLLAAEYTRLGDTAHASEVAAATDNNRASNPIAYVDPLFASVVQLNRSASRQNQLGNRFRAEGNSQLAAEHFARAVAVMPERAGLHMNYGLSLLDLGRTAEAARELEEARRLDPKSEDVRQTLYRAYALIPESRDKALSEAKAWRAQEPASVTPLTVLADLYLTLGRYQEALKAYAEARKLDPANPVLWTSEARMLAATGRHASALQQYQQTLETFRGDAATRVELARLLATSPDGTVRNGRQSVALGEALMGGQRTVIRAETLALGLAESGRWDEALAQIRWALAGAGDAGGPKLRARLQREMKAIEARRPWREAWPFQTLNE